MAASAMEKIKHLVVVMMENRSFDNLLGFLYAQQNNQPPMNLPAQKNGGTTFEGLTASPQSPFWNPANQAFFTKGAEPAKVFATCGTQGAEPFVVPNHDPHEEFAHMSYQILGPDKWTGDKMRGFLVDYITTDPGHPDNGNQLMQCYSPAQVSVLSGLARNYAVSDRWFCSTPNQTLPNRAFVHAGTCMGRVNNSPQYLYDAETIFEVLRDTGHSWRVYNDTVLMSLARLQFPQLWDPLLQEHFHDLARFEADAQAGELPEYSFVEPSFVFQPNDEHPPHDVRLGEQFLMRVWKAVSQGRDWNETLLVITFDEHGGCYDHVVPPPAVAPDPESNPGEAGFRFDRYGVRVPAILVSPYIEAGTVFRSDTDVPYDHTSILATLRDWLKIPVDKMLQSKRIEAAPTFANVLTRVEPRTDLPTITASEATPGPKAKLIAFNDLQKAIFQSHARRYAHNLANPFKLRSLRTPPRVHRRRR